jgi:hypothetical protein
MFMFLILDNRSNVPEMSIEMKLSPTGTATKYLHILFTRESTYPAPKDTLRKFFTWASPTQPHNNFHQYHLLLSIASSHTLIDW